MPEEMTPEEFWKDAPDPEEFPDGDDLDSEVEQAALPADSFPDTDATEEEH